MKALYPWLLTLALVAGVLPTSPVRACPVCVEALDRNDSDADDPMQEAKAYALSIYLMAGMPYLIFGVGGFLLYRSMRNARKDTPPQA